MAKFFGNVGYDIPTEVERGVWVDANPVERPYYGEVINNAFRNQSSSGVNGNIVVTNQISIISDPFAYENFHKIKYVWYMGTRWIVTKVDVQYPRLILTLGEVYTDGQQTRTANNA